MAPASWHSHGRSRYPGQALHPGRRHFHRKLARRPTQASIAAEIFAVTTDWDLRPRHPRRTRRVVVCSSRQTPFARIQRAHSTTAARQIGSKFGLASAHPEGVRPSPTAHPLTKPCARRDAACRTFPRHRAFPLTCVNETRKPPQKRSAAVARPVHRTALGGNVVDVGDPGITAI